MMIRRLPILIAVAMVASTFLLFHSFAEEPSEKVSPDIVTAAKEQQWKKVAAMIEWGIDVNAAAPDGMTALHYATLEGDESTAASLIRNGANVKAATIYEVTPLHIACMHGQTEIAKLLFDHAKDEQLDPNSRLISGETVLMQAARTGIDSMVELLIEKGADPNANDKKGQTALMWAAAEGHVAVVYRLLKAEAKIDATLGSGFTALGFAAREGRIEVVEFLIKAGADVNTAMQPKNTSGRAPRSGMSPLMLAVESGHFELALRLVELGADPNDQRSGYAPLHALSWVRKPDRGDSVSGDPAPRGSGSVSSIEFVRKLVESGADVNLQLKKGKGSKARLNPGDATPILLAAHTADLPLLELLVELGGDISIPNADRCTPFLAAAGVGVFVAGEFPGTEPEVIETIQYLHSQGAESNTVDENGETALHGAAYRSFPKVVHELVSLNVDAKFFDQRNKLGSTPLQVAQGKRPGSFKPDKATIRAIRNAMKGD